MITSVFSLAHKDLFAKKTRVLVGIASIAIGTAFAAMLTFSTTSFFAYIEKSVSAGMATNEVRVTPKYSVGFFKVTKQEQRKLDDTVLKELQALPEVEKARVETVLKYPTSLAISIFNTSFETDAPLYGVDDELFKKFTADTTPLADGVVPILLSKELVDIYNIGVASAISKPKLNEDFLLGFEFDLKIGYSSFFSGTSLPASTIKKARVVGIATGIPIIGITLRASDVAALNTRYVDKYTPEYTRIYLTMKHPEEFAQLAKKIDALGFEVFSFEQEVAPLRSQVQMALYFAVAIVSVVFVLIMLTMFFLFYSEYQEKQYLVSLLKVLGGTKNDIAKFFYYQAVEMIALGILVGLVLGYASSYLLVNGAGALLQISGFVLTVPLHIPFVVFLLMAAMMLVSVVIPVRLAQKVEPKEVLAGR